MQCFSGIIGLIHIAEAEGELMDFLKANYHTHTTRCLHAYDSEEEYIEAAIEMGIVELGFSDHVPCPFKDGSVSGIRMTMEQVPDYVSTIRRLGEAYKKYIRLYVGFEAEYCPEFFQEQMNIFRKYKCDYLIMGQHFLGNEFVGPYMGAVTTDESRIRDYVDRVIEGMRTGEFLYLAHPDLINYQGLDSVYDWEMSRLCKAMKELNIPLEINLLGMSEGRQYPNEQFWKLAGENGNQVILGLDAHSAMQMKNVNCYNKAMEMVEKYNLNLIKRIDIKNAE